MAILIADRVQETSTSPGGTGTLTLTGSPVPGYKSFANGIGTGNSLYYTIYDAVTYAWEVGIGSWSANVLTRTTVLSNSLNTTAFISFTNGNTLNVWVDYPASSAVTQTDVGTAPNQVPLNQYLGKLAFEDVLDTISNNPYYDTQISDVEPTLNLDFVNSKTLDSRITFTRSTTATYYDGKTSAVAEQNLLTYSQLFNTGWSPTAVTVTNNVTTAPDGTTTASSLIESSATSAHNDQWSTALTSGTYTISVYAKPLGSGSTRYLTLAMQAGASVFYSAVYDLSAGTVLNTNGLGGCTYIASSITATANGYYRCVLTGTNPYSQQGNISLSNVTTAPTANYGANSYAGDGVSGLYIWGAQVEQRSSATAYNATTTTALTNYIPVLQTAAINAPRLDYSPTAGTPNGLLIEQQSNNGQIYSQSLANTSGWNAMGSAVINGTADIAPDGTQTAASITPVSNGNTNGITAVNAGGIYLTNRTLSFYVKANGITSIIGQSGAGETWSLNLITGLFSNVNATYTNYSATSVGNGWFRAQITYNTTTGNGLYIGSTSGANSFNSFFLWGIQVEIGAFPTSYIPTVASQVTRSADSAVMTGTNLTQWWNSSQGTFYCDSVGQFTSTTSGTSRNWVSGNASSSNLLYTNAGSNTLLSYDGISVGNTTGITNLSAQNKIALVYSIGANSKNNFANGVSGQGGLMTSAWTLNTTLNFGYGYSGWFKKLQYYPQALSSAEIQEMTS